MLDVGHSPTSLNVRPLGKVTHERFSSLRFLTAELLLPRQLVEYTSDYTDFLYNVYSTKVLFADKHRCLR